MLLRGALSQTPPDALQSLQLRCLHLVRSKPGPPLANNFSLPIIAVHISRRWETTLQAMGMQVGAPMILSRLHIVRAQDAGPCCRRRVAADSEQRRAKRRSVNTMRG